MKILTAIGAVSSLAILALAGTVYYQTTVAARASTPDPVQFPASENLVLLQPVEPQPVTKHTVEDLHCLALNIYFEARNESDLAQRAVAWVTINRAYHTGYPNTLCEVVWDPQQFSWTHDGKSDQPRDAAAWQRAQTIASEMILRYESGEDPTEGAVMYHADYSRPYWRNSYERVVQIDSHIFYREK